MQSAPGKILLVEAEPVLAEVTSFHLELLGHFVTTVETGEAAFEQITQDRPDIAIVDLELSDMPGSTLVERLAADASTSELPVMVVSMDAELDRVQEMYHLGAHDYLVVPYHPSVLEEKVGRLLRQAREAQLRLADEAKAAEKDKKQQDRKAAAATQ